MTCTRCLWPGWRGSFGQTLWAVHSLDGETRAHFQLAYYQICVHCTYPLNLDQLAYYSIDQTCAHCTFFLLNLLNQELLATCSCTLHIIFSSHCIALDIVHCSFQLSEKLKLRVSHQLHPVRLAKLVIFIRADNFIFLEKFTKWGGVGFHIQRFRVSKLINLKSKGVCW